MGISKFSLRRNPCHPMKHSIKNKFIGGTLAVLFSLIFLFFSGCGQVRQRTFSKLEDFNQPGVKIAVDQGSAAEQKARTCFKKAEIKAFNSSADVIAALTEHKVDGYAYDRVILTDMARNKPEMTVIPDDYDKVPVAAGLNKEDGKLLEQVNEQLQQFNRSGVLEDMKQRWMEQGITEMPANLGPGEASWRELKVGTSASAVPYTYMDNGRLNGYDIELAYRLGQALNRRVVFKIMSYDALVAALETGKIDLILASLNITPEREKLIAFSTPYTDSRSTVMLLKSSWTGKAAAVGKLIYNTAGELNGKRLGVATGTILDILSAKYLPDSPYNYYNDYPNCLQDLKAGKIEGFLTDEPVARLYEAENPDIGYIKKPMETNEIGIGISRNRPELKNVIDEGLKRYRQDGTLKKMDQIWFGTDETTKKMPEVKTGTKGKVVAQTSADVPPMTYIKDEKVVGYEAALITSILQDAGYEVEMKVSDFAGLVPGLTSGKVDLIFSTIVITEERKKTMLFSEPDYHSSIVVMTRRAGGAENSQGFWAGIKSSFNRNFLVEDRYKMVLEGLKVTIIISLASAFLGTILGFGICLLRRSSKKIFNLPAALFIKIMQGTPLVVFLMIMYYIVFGGFDINPVYVGILAFAVNESAYVAQMMRSGIDAVDKGQWEAASALGFTRIQAFIKIVAPQALQHIMPVYTGELISLVKMTSVVGYIAIQDLTKMSDIIRSRTYEAFFPLIATALIYLAVAWSLTAFLNYLAARVDPKKRPRTLKGVKI